MLLELALGLIFLLFIYDFWHKKHRNEIFKKFGIPGPKTLPILGNAIDIKHLNNDNAIDFVWESKQKYGKIYRMWMLHEPNVFIMDPKYLEIILASQQMLNKSRHYNFLVGWLGSGLLLSYGKKWHSRRKIITPAFHFKILEQFVEVFDQQSNVMVQKLYEKADGKTAINIFPIVCLCALDIIAETAMGVKVNAQDQPDLEYTQAVATLSRIMSDRFIKPLQRTDFLFRLTAPRVYRESERCIKVLHKFTTDVIEQRRLTLQQSIKDGSFKNATKDGMNSTSERSAVTHILKHTIYFFSTEETEDFDLNTRKRMALLDVLLQSTVDGNYLTNEDIREEVDTFMFEGHDTTTSGISFALYLIARSPEVQCKLVAEIKEVLGTDKNKPVTYRELQELKYMEMVIKESQRLYPSVPAIGREIKQDITVGDIVLPAKTNITLFLFMVLRDPDYFTNPDHFMPERFASNINEKINPFAYTPFSAGPRNCIGQKFAMLEMKSTLSKMLRHFELLPLGPDVKPVINLILRSTTGVHVGLRKRDL